MADAVEVCSGSRQLLQILNRLGCTSSPDTHDRFVTQHAEAQRSKSLWCELPKGVFTVASVDNFDMLQSYSIVYCGDQSRSYHGTTIQLVQPSPAIVYPSNPTVRTEDNQTTAQASHVVLEVTPPKRMRTVYARDLTNNMCPNTSTNSSESQMSGSTIHSQSTLTLADFLESSEELKEQQDCKTKMFMYVLQAYLLHQQCEDNAKESLSDMRHFINEKQPDAVDLQISKIHYMELVNENPDSNDTMALVAEELLDRFTDDVQDGWVVLVGDGKTYQHLMAIKRMYGDTLKRLLIFPGDWHILKNFQSVVMKIYYNAGLRELAKASGFQGATLTSLEKCSNFKHTHRFLLQVWEALYREMINAYVTSCDIKNLTNSAKSILSKAFQENHLPNHLTRQIKQLIEDSNTEENFMKFVYEQTDHTWKLWVQFVFSDCYCYITLYLAVRGSNWNLCLYSLKQMAPLFAVLDRSIYERIIPNHLADIKKFPNTILSCLRSGGFTVNVSASGQWHAVALDEAHEMCINKDLKGAVVRPTSAYLQETTLFFNERIRAFKNLTQQLFPEKSTTKIQSVNAFTGTTISHQEENIRQMCAEIKKHKLLQLQPSTNRGIINVFSGQTATREQANDMLNCRQIGIESFQSYIQYHILKTSSPVSAPVRRKRLLMMTTAKSKRKQTSARDKENK